MAFRSRRSFISSPLWTPKVYGRRHNSTKIIFFLMAVGLQAHIKANHRQTCPYCRVKIEKQAPNMLLQQLIDGFTQKKVSFFFSVTLQTGVDTQV